MLCTSLPVSRKLKLPIFFFLFLSGGSLYSMQNVDFSIEDGPTVRAIMLYTRSDVLPTLSDNEVPVCVKKHTKNAIDRSPKFQDKLMTYND